MRYSLVITQTAEGETTVTAVDAEGALCGGALVLKYSYDGAQYTLEISESAMAQTRDGDVKLYMKFAEGQTTAARLSDGSTCGEFPVFTRRLQVRFDGAEVKAGCLFSYGACGGEINLSVTATILQ